MPYRSLLLLLSLLACAPALGQATPPPAAPEIIIDEEAEPIPAPLPPDPQQLPPPPPAGPITEALAGRVPYHGNYCGRGNRGGEPVDDLDAACKAHDDCYDRDGDGACSCDRALERETLRLADDKLLSPELRRRAASIGATFQVVPCRR